MKLRLEIDGRVFEYERKPMQERRFKALCGLAAGGLYVALVWAVATLCGLLGVVVVALLTLFLGMGKLMDI